MISDDDNIAARGQWGRVVWVGVYSGCVPQPRQFYLGLACADKAKVLALFNRLAATGQIHNREKFRSLGENYGPVGRGLFEFKSFRIRLIGAFRPGCQFWIARGLEKKKDRHDRSDLEIAQKVLQECDALISVKGGAR